ncbi:hypothetical protein ARMGADRAFT_1035683 [Armillaria gallica]|uniref:Uncharacterized protein n=1 Tax=Armillaria gallica TaxID=47427 RepID=A0A2H3D5Z6_ARMGA|nr:hypothetical protein ARMGADRAFT_1035683 [Armillaria gallica]
MFFGPKKWSTNGDCDLQLSHTTFYGIMVTTRPSWKHQNLVIWCKTQYCMNSVKSRLAFPVKDSYLSVNITLFIVWLKDVLLLRILTIPDIAKGRCMRDCPVPCPVHSKDAMPEISKSFLQQNYHSQGWSRRLNGPYRHVNISRSPITLWTTHVHPKGAKYFLRKDNRWTIVTDANITHAPTFTAIQHFIDGLVAMQQTIAHTEEIFHANDVDLVLDIVQDETGHVICKYYLAYHLTRKLILVTLLISIVFQLLSVIQMYAIKAQFWHHWALYPSIACLSQYVLKELCDQICHGISDSLISPMSMVAHAPEELRTMLEVLPMEVTEIANAPGRCRILFILLKHFAKEKLSNFHREPAV